MHENKNVLTVPRGCTNPCLRLRRKHEGPFGPERAPSGPEGALSGLFGRGDVRPGPQIPPATLSWRPPVRRARTTASRGALLRAPPLSPGRRDATLHGRSDTTSAVARRQRQTCETRRPKTKAALKTQEGQILTQKNRGG